MILPLLVFGNPCTKLDLIRLGYRTNDTRNRMSNILPGHVLIIYLALEDHKGNKYPAP